VCIAVVEEVAVLEPAADVGTRAVPRVAITTIQADRRPGVDAAAADKGRSAGRERHVLGRTVHAAAITAAKVVQHRDDDTRNRRRVQVILPSCPLLYPNRRTSLTHPPVISRLAPTQRSKVYFFFSKSCKHKIHTCTGVIAAADTA
jgi:hypothetical protein